MRNEVVINGELFWSKWMKSFNTAFNDDNDRYECTVGNISDADCEKLKTLGIKIKHKDSMGNFIVGKTKDYKYYNLQDASGKAVDSDIIGNGTKVIVTLSSYETKMTKMHGMSPSINKIVVTDLIKYEASPAPAEAELDDVL